MAISNDSNPKGAENAAQAQKDRSGFSTTVANVTGGEFKDVGDESGLEVGNCYDADPMGEKDEKITWKKGS